MICLNCTQDMGDVNGKIQVTELVLHIEISKVSRFNICENVEFLSLLRYIKHQIFYHTFVGRQIFSYIELLYGAKPKFLSAGLNVQDFVTDSIFTVRPQLSTSIKSKNLSVGQKNLKTEFNAIYTEFKDKNIQVRNLK